MELSDAEQALCRKLNVDYTTLESEQNALFTSYDIDAYINTGAKRAWDYKPWTFTEGIVTLTAPSPTTSLYDYPETFEDESIFLVIVNNVPWIGPNKGKRNFAEYMRWLSQLPTDQSLIWTEFARQYYLNQNAYLAGQSYSLYGKLRAPFLQNGTDLLPFSPDTDNDENSGNTAIILLAYADALNSEKKKNPQGAQEIEQLAFAMLDLVWLPMGERKAEKVAQHQPFFNDVDLFRQSRGRQYPGNF